MASRSYRTNKKSASKRARSSGRRKYTEKKLKHRWTQRGCQNQKGGGSMTGGWAWGPSDVHAQTAGTGGNSPVPQSINGNHYALNTNTLALPESSNAIVERQNTIAAAQSAGRRRGRGRGLGRGRGRGRSLKGNKKNSRKLACQSGGGIMSSFPEIIKPAMNTTLQGPSNIVSGLQGPATAPVSADPTIQPIGQPITLK